MLESEVGLCGSRVLSPLISGDEYEELSVLPRHTKVIVTGNNRTKSVLVGLHGVVKKAVGLGGWHWLVLKNGVEVKLQRNALSVLEHPTGNEEHDFDCESSTSTELGYKDLDFCSSTELSKPIKLRARKKVKPVAAACSSSAKSTNRSDGYKEVQSLHTPQWSLNFGRLETDSLRKYSRYFKLGSNHCNPSREQLIIAVEQHFYSHMELREEAVIAEFAKAAAKRIKAAASAEKRKKRARV